jgi:hypothetical protein
MHCHALCSYFSHKLKILTKHFFTDGILYVVGKKQYDVPYWAARTSAVVPSSGVTYNLVGN